MPSASRSTTPVAIDLDVVEGRYAVMAVIGSNIAALAKVRA